MSRSGNGNTRRSPARTAPLFYDQQPSGCGRPSPAAPAAGSPPTGFRRHGLFRAVSFFRPFRRAARPSGHTKNPRKRFNLKNFSYFCLQNRKTIKIRYGVQFQGDRAEVAATLARTEDLQGRDGPLASEILCPRHVSLPVGGGASRRPPAGLHRLGHLFALQAAQGLQRPASDGLRRLRASGRAVCHPDGPAPGRDDRTEHRPLPRAAGQDRFFVRLGPRGAHVRPRLLQVDAVGLPRNVLPLL